MSFMKITIDAYGNLLKEEKLEYELKFEDSLCFLRNNIDSFYEGLVSYDISEYYSITAEILNYRISKIYLIFDDKNIRKIIEIIKERYKENSSDDIIAIIAKYFGIYEILI